MNAIPLQQRTDLALRLHTWITEVSEEVGAHFLARFAAGLEDDRARMQARKEACFHMSSLAGALEGGSVAAFEEHVRWCARMQLARGVAPHLVGEKLDLLDRALARRLSPEASRQVSAFLSAGRRVCGEASLKATVAESGNGLGHTRSRFLKAILGGWRSSAAEVALEAMEEGFPLDEVYFEVLRGSLHEVGRMWEDNTISVAQEHMATAVTQYVMAQLYSRLERTAPHGGRMVICGPEGESHQIGAQMVADLFEVDGWDVRFLGTDMPHAGIVRTVETHRADVLGISATLLSSVPAVVCLVGQVQWHCSARPPRILLGGRAFYGLDELAQELGVAGIGKDYRAARALARSTS